VFVRTEAPRSVLGQVAAEHHDVIIPCDPNRLTENVKHTGTDAFVVEVNLLSSL